MANRIRHNLKSSRWTIQDKLLQHRSLVKLYERDAKVLSSDRYVSEKRAGKEIRQLKKNIKQQRDELNNAIRGGRQQHRNMLAEHKSLQMAFQDRLPTQTIEHITHKNFNKRKVLDRLESTMKKKIDQLTQHKLTLAQLQDNITYGHILNVSPIEVMGQRISGKVQEAQIKQDAALQIQRTYKNILGILKKDRIYFDMVLNQIKDDTLCQSQCIYQATKIGQLATEYTDDRKQELCELQQAIKRDMRSRIAQLRVVEDQVKILNSSLHHLVRKETESQVVNEEVETTEDCQIRHLLKDVNRVLTLLKEQTYAPTFEGIVSSIDQQQRKYKEMVELLAKHHHNREILVNKLTQAKTMHVCLETITPESTLEFIDKRQQVLGQLEIKQRELKKLKSIHQERANLLAQIRMFLLHLRQISRVLRTSSTAELKHAVPKLDTMFMSLFASTSSGDTIIWPPEPSEENAIKLLAEVEARLTFAIATANKHHLDLEIDVRLVQDAYGGSEVEKEYQKFIYQISSKVFVDERPPPDFLLLELESKDVKVPSADTIKKESAVLVDQNKKPDWML